MDHGFVDAQVPALLQRPALEILDAVREALAQRQMAGGVLVEQGLVEQQAAPADGRIVGHQRALAQIAAALVHGDHLGEQGLVLLCVPLHRLALLKTDPEILDQLALIAQGLGGVDDALRLSLHGGGEALLRGHVGVEGHAADGILAAAAEPALRDQTHGEVRAVGAGVAELFNAHGVEPVTVGLKGGVVGFPFRHRILPDPAGVQDRLPELLHRLRGPQLREHLLGPGLAGNRGDAPLIFVLHLIPVGLDDGIAGLLGLGDLGLVDAP